MESQPVNTWTGTDLMYKLAEIVRGYRPDDAEMLRQMARTFERNPDLPRTLGVFGNLLTQSFECPYCGDTYPVDPMNPEAHKTMRVLKLVCSSGRDYAAGYRTVWRCDKCGEQEIR